MATQEQFAEMLRLDAQTFAKLSEAKVLIDDYLAKNYQVIFDAEKPEVAAFLAAKTLNTELIARYNERQNDYKTNTAYKASQWLTTAADDVTTFFSDIFGMGQLGDGGLITVPLIITAGAVISVAVVSYFVSSYYDDTVLDYNSSLGIIAEVSKTNPELAKQLAEDVAALQSDQQNDEGFFDSVGTAVGFSVAAVGLAAAVGIGVKVYNSQAKNKAA